MKWHTPYSLCKKRWKLPRAWQCKKKTTTNFLHLKFILRTETFAYVSFCITVAVGGWLLLHFSFQVPTDVIVSLRSGIREDMDFLVVCAVELSCWECPYCLSLTLRLARISVWTRTLRNWAIHCSVMLHHISAFILFNCMRICWLSLCIFCVLTHEHRWTYYFVPFLIWEKFNTNANKIITPVKSQNGL